jgi:hypothetical protein
VKTSPITYISWAFYLIGTAIVLGSYVGVVSPGIGWIGWIIGMIGWGMQFVVRKQK